MRGIPFSVVAPATIAFFGAFVAILTIVLGVQDLGTRAADNARHEAQALAHALSFRLASAPAKDRAQLLENAAGACACTLLLFDAPGKVSLAAPSQPLSLSALAQLDTPRGSVELESGRHYFAQALLPIYPGTQMRRQAKIAALVARPDISGEQQALVTSVATFAILLVALAGSVGWALARDVHADVLFVRDRIATMAAAAGAPKMEVIPVRTIDQVGQLTASFNTLLQRFQAAERAYRQDMSQARDFDQDRAAFLSALSHELRTPLNAILGFTDVLLDELDGPLSHDARENLTIVRTSGEHLRSLIDDILALSALESGEFRLSREQLDLFSVAQDVVTEARLTALQKGLKVHLFRSGDEDSTIAYADRRRMRQIFGNVISNAIKFTNQGEVTVRMRRDLDTVVTTISDTGPGIAEEQLEAIFEEFQQAESGNAKRMGTGLGLSITRRLVQLHGGTVRAESTQGQGSTFIIRIPIEERTAQKTIPELVGRITDPIIRES